MAHVSFIWIRSIFRRVPFTKVLGMKYLAYSKTARQGINAIT